jgi:hypothetical protein
LKCGIESRNILSLMNQRDLDKDLVIRFDDTGALMPFPEQEEGFEDNPIRQLFEQVEDLEVKEEDE